MPRRSRLRRRRSKKSLPELVRTVHQLLPPNQVEFWGMDEHRIGLKPILRRVWARRGQRPTVVVHPRYQWSYVYGFVHPRSGRTFFLILPTVSLTAFEVALREFARFLGAGPNKHVFLVLDRAGWHTSRQLLLPPGLHLCFLPPYSPELQPAEHLWPLTNRPLVNRCFDSLDDLEAVQAEQCRFLQQCPELVRSATLFHWWPDRPLQ